MHKTANFKPETDPKMACSCCGKGGLSMGMLVVLEWLKQACEGAAVNITSGARCVKYNRSEEVGGVRGSDHEITDIDLTADGADVQVKGYSPTRVMAILKSAPFANLLALGKYKEFTHVGLRGYPARW